MFDLDDNTRDRLRSVSLTRRQWQLINNASVYGANQMALSEIIRSEWPETAAAVDALRRALGISKN